MPEAPQGQNQLEDFVEKSDSTNPSGGSEWRTMSAGYNPVKAAQAVAFLVRGRGGQTDIIDISKLVYLCDRAFMERYDRPILFDDFFCVDHGPVNSITYDSIKIEGQLAKPWSDYIQPRRGHEITINKDLNDDSFGELSAAEERIMMEVLEEHKHRRSFKLVDWIHEHCREWSNPRGTSTSLTYSQVWKALGRPDLNKMDKHIEELSYIAQSIECK